jgi:hypothetical protein
MGKFLILLGAVLIAVGALLHFTGRIPWLGRLPGDFVIRRENFAFFFPLGTSILLSVVITLLLWLFRR